MADFKFPCPHCAQHLQCDDALAGRQIKCPRCDHLIHIPPAPGKTADYQPESGKTWATYVAPANVQSPKGLSLKPRPDPPNSPKS